MGEVGSRKKKSVFCTQQSSCNKERNKMIRLLFFQMRQIVARKRFPLQTIYLTLRYCSVGAYSLMLSKQYTMLRCMCGPMAVDTISQAFLKVSSENTIL